ncbi:beta-ketoacyl synthase N-terminal-like domain-containing protein [Actinomadura violacea]|uniref:Beta-ketoacyl synthase-like N-terminal domain-containing protein n=1 Tax=Actinomadura violacea TaxID=2819934 RepID=A0ABS3RNT0_9ACTN|nr:beta-ketoacyl synthase N-terminal-like domain-containing protein [Actinomadura violacea]MBO2458327.1 hypothetical protein [Actinomadura violacea]
MNPLITGWTAVSPYGVGRAAFAAGVRADGTAVAPLDRAEWGGPPVREAARVPIGAPRDVLGRKGTRTMDRATAMAVLAARDLLRDPSPEEAEAVPEAEAERTALVLGVSTGPIASLMDFTADSFTRDRPYLVDAARFPGALMNFTAAQLAIWHRLRGPNSTIAASRVAGLAALGYALRLQRAGRADTVLCGAVEEFTEERAWLEWHAAPPGALPPVLGEGCAMVRLTMPAAAADQGPAAELAAVASGLAGPDNAAQVLERCARRALAEAGERPDDVWAVAPADPPGPPGDAEAEAIDALFGRADGRGGGPVRVRTAGRLGDTHAASAAFQTAAVLALAEHDEAAAGRPALITAVDRDGAVACAVLRPAAGRRPG